MTNRNTYPYSQDFYHEIQEEVERINNAKNGIHLTDIELIDLHLKCLEQAVLQYTNQIREALNRIRENQKEVLK